MGLGIIPTVMDKGSKDLEHIEAEELTDSDALEGSSAVSFNTPTATRRKISPSSVTSSPTMERLDVLAVNENILSRCCCMFEEIQSELRRVTGNATCCDCGAPEPQWASVTLASLVCIRCAGMHRALGIKKSRIRSLQMDSWSRSQVLRMLMGGNSKLKEAFAMTGGNFDALDIRARYNSLAATEYVANLNTRCPPTTPATPTPRLDAENRRISPSPFPIRKFTFTSASHNEHSPNSKVHQPELQTVSSLHRAYCPCSSRQRWTHLPTIGGRQKKMRILCSGEPRHKNCVVSSLSKLKAGVLYMCGGGMCDGGRYT